MGGLPTGSVTFLFSDVVGSTALWETSPDAMRAAMARHDEVILAAVDAAGGEVVKPRGEGDSTFAVFGSTVGAVSAARSIVLGLEAEAWPTPRPVRVRVAVHTGEADLRAGDYYGDAVNRCARLRAIGHGGQVLVSSTTAAVLGRGLPADLALQDLGEHRLKDLTTSERVFQLAGPGLATGFPPLLSLNRAKHNLPIQLSTFIGREQAIAEVSALVMQHRLVTITGFGGMGKTRLALQVGAELAVGDGDGVWFIDLSSVRDATLLADAVARTLGVAASADPLASVVSYLADKRILLICDSLEQLLPDAAGTIAALTTAGAGVRVLVTSRDVVGVRGEHVYRLPPLASPRSAGQDHSPLSLGTYDAVTLFIARASAADPGFEVNNTTAPAVSAICAAVDGWPLALELAAARVRMIGLEGLLARLSDRLDILTGGPRDLPDRQRTLRETIAWSYDLLEPAGQRLLNRLSAFAATVDLAAIEAVCAPELGADTLDTLASLLDKSLVNTVEAPGGRRYRLLEAIREYAHERLEGSGELAAVSSRHAAFVRDAFPDPDHGPLGEAEFSLAVPDIAAAVEELRPSPADAAELYLAVQARLLQLGHLTLGLKILEGLRLLPGLDPATLAALDISEQCAQYLVARPRADPEVLEAAATALIGAERHPYMAFSGAFLLSTWLAEKQDSEGALAWAERSVEVAELLRTPTRRPHALVVLAQAQHLAGHPSQAVGTARRALSLAEPLGNPVTTTNALVQLCLCLISAGELVEACQVGSRASELGRQVGGGWRAEGRGAFGRALLVAGEHEQAAAELLESLVAYRDSGLFPGDLAWAAVALHRVAPELGATLYGVISALGEQVKQAGFLPPPDLLSRVEKLYEDVHADDVARGRALGWPGVVTLIDRSDLLQEGVGPRALS